MHPVLAKVQEEAEPVFSSWLSISFILLLSRTKPRTIAPQGVQMAARSAKARRRRRRTEKRLLGSKLKMNWRIVWIVQTCLILRPPCVRPFFLLFRHSPLTRNKSRTDPRIYNPGYGRAGVAGHGKAALQQAEGKKKNWDRDLGLVKTTKREGGIMSLETDRQPLFEFARHGRKGWNLLLMCVARGSLIAQIFFLILNFLTSHSPRI